MIIHNSEALITQLAAGGGVQLNGNNLATQNSVQAFFQTIGDVFRSHTSITSRNDTLTFAMSNMLRGPAGQGPQNLATNRPNISQLSEAEKKAALKDAKNNILGAIMRSQVDQAYPNQSPAMKQVIARHLTKWAMITPNDIDSLHKLAGQAITFAQQKPNFLELMSLLCPISLSPAELKPQRIYLEAYLQTICLNARDHTVKHEKPVYNSDHISHQSLTDVTRDRPIINGVSVTQTTSQTRAEHYTNMISNFALNNDEREVLTTLLSQEILAPLSYMWMNAENSPPIREEVPLNEKSSDCYIGGFDHIPKEVPRFQMIRDNNGDASIHIITSLETNATLDDIRYSSADLPVRNGMCHYDIIVPHGQFQNPLSDEATPQVLVQNMRIVPEDVRI